MYGRRPRCSCACWLLGSARGSVTFAYGSASCVLARSWSPRRRFFDWDFSWFGPSYRDVNVLVGCGVDRDVVGGNFIAEFVDEPDAHRASGAPGSPEHAGAFFAGQMLVAPVRQCTNNNMEFATYGGQVIGRPAALPGLLVRPAGHDAVVDQSGQAVRQCVGGKAEFAFEIGVAGLACQCFPQDQ